MGRARGQTKAATQTSQRRDPFAATFGSDRGQADGYSRDEETFRQTLAVTDSAVEVSRLINNDCPDADMLLAAAVTRLHDSEFGLSEQDITKLLAAAGKVTHDRPQLWAAMDKIVVDAVQPTSETGRSRSIRGRLFRSALDQAVHLPRTVAALPAADANQDFSLQEILHDWAMTAPACEPPELKALFHDRIVSDPLAYERVLNTRSSVPDAGSAAAYYREQIMTMTRDGDTRARAVAWSALSSAPGKLWDKDMRQVVARAPRATVNSDIKGENLLSIRLSEVLLGEDHSGGLHDLAARDLANVLHEHLQHTGFNKDGDGALFLAGQPQALLQFVAARQQQPTPAAIQTLSEELIAWQADDYRAVIQLCALDGLGGIAAHQAAQKRVAAEAQKRLWLAVQFGNENPTEVTAQQMAPIVARELGQLAAAGGRESWNRLLRSSERADEIIAHHQKRPLRRDRDLVREFGANEWTDFLQEEFNLTRAFRGSPRERFPADVALNSLDGYLSQKYQQQSLRSRHIRDKNRR